MGVHIFSMANKKIHSLIRVFLFLISILSVTLIKDVANADSTIQSSFNIYLEDNSISKRKEDIDFSPEVGKVYEFNVLISNISSEKISLLVFSSMGISTTDFIEYTEKSSNLLNSKYDLSQYITLESEGVILKDNILEIGAQEKKKVTVKIKIPEEMEGELIGGINFSQVLEKDKNEGSIELVQTYEKVMVVHLKLNNYSNINPQEYKNFEFLPNKDGITFSYYNYNNNPQMVYSEGEKYKLINPDNQVISEGAFAKEKVVLTPFTKTKITLPLLEDTELKAGEYQFIVTQNGKDILNKFSYNPEKIEKLVKDSKGTNQVTIESKNGSTLLIGIIAIVVVAGTVMIIVKRFKK